MLWLIYMDIDCEILHKEYEEMGIDCDFCGYSINGHYEDVCCKF